jgi:hypothetical protein
MDRLTVREPHKSMAYLTKVKTDEQEIEASRNTCLCIMESWERLAAYEDTGMTPAECLASREEVKRLTAIVQKEMPELKRAVDEFEPKHRELCSLLDSTVMEKSALSAERDGLAKWQAQAREVMRVLLSRYSMLNPNIKDRLRKLAGESPIP